MTSGEATGDLRPLLSALQDHGASFHGPDGWYDDADAVLAAGGSDRALLDYRADVELPPEPDGKYEPRLEEPDVTGRLDFRYGDGHGFRAKVTYGLHSRESENAAILEDLADPEHVAVEPERVPKARIVYDPGVEPDPAGLAAAADEAVEIGTGLIDALAEDAVESFR